MRLLTGPPGSGKTAFVLDALRTALRGGNHRVRLLVPTATMARHLQNRLAREGFVLRRSHVQTLNKFVDTYASDLTQVPDTVLHLIVEQAIRRVGRPEFAEVGGLHGFCASLTKVVQEFASAGCDSTRLAGHLPQAPLAAAFLAVYREVDRDLAARGLALRSTRLSRAAARIAADGVPGIEHIWIDGFHALPDPELEFISALGKHVDLTVTVAENNATAPTRARLRERGFQQERAGLARSTPALQLVKAPGIEREAEEIARQVLAQVAAGRPFREMGIVVRSAESYVPILRSTLERFGIPAGFYFDEPLDRHPAVRFLSGILDAMLGGWDHEQTLAAILLAPRYADSGAMDRFHFTVREQLPNAGLGALEALLLDHPSNERLLHFLQSLATLEEWRNLALCPADWAGRFETLRDFFRPARPESPISHELALAFRSQAEVLDEFRKAVEEAALALPAGQDIDLAEFWRTVKSVLRLKPLRLEDARRNVVHVISAHEARQWALPVVFICGMVEKQFPRFHQQDPFFPDAARCALNAAGIRVRTTAEFEIEERALFEAAISRAGILTVLTCPEFDARGDRLLPSLYLEDLFLPASEAPSVRPAPRRPLTLAQPAAIGAPAALEYLATRSAKISPSAVEAYLQCAFQYFGRQTLRLRPAPKRPQERLDFLTGGIVIHEVLRQWWPDRSQNIETLLDAEFQRIVEEKHIPQAYRTERMRNAMLDDLRAFAVDDQWPAGYTSRTELDFTFPLGPIEIRGKIDRLDTAPDGRAFVIDYKYSAAKTTKSKRTNENLVQAPIYLMAAERCFGLRPAGMFYIGLKPKPLYVGWSVPPMLDAEPLPEDWLPKAEALVLEVVSQIRAGRIEVLPADPGNCRYCDFRDACRVRTGEAEVEVEGGAAAEGA